MLKQRRGAVWRRANPSSSSFTPDGSPFFHFARALGLYNQKMDWHLKRAGLDVPRWRVLNLLYTAPGSSISALSDMAVIRLPTMTKLINRMKLEHLVTTSTSSVDARVTVVHLSTRGGDRLEAVRDTVAGVFERAFATIDDSQITQVMDIARTIHLNLEG